MKLHTAMSASGPKTTGDSGPTAAIQTNQHMALQCAGQTGMTAQLQACASYSDLVFGLWARDASVSDPWGWYG